MLAVETVGGIIPRMAPGALVMPDQVIDHTHGRDATYWETDGEGTMRHAGFGEPYGASMRAAAREAATAAGVALVEPATCGATEGPRFESIAEIARMARDGRDLVGMTGMPESALARELEIDYACLAPVANRAAGRGARGTGLRDVPSITLDEVFANLERATGPLFDIISAMLAADRPWSLARTRVWGLRQPQRLDCTVHQGRRPPDRGQHADLVARIAGGHRPAVRTAHPARP